MHKKLSKGGMKSKNVLCVGVKDFVENDKEGVVANIKNGVIFKKLYFNPAIIDR